MNISENIDLAEFSMLTRVVVGTPEPDVVDALLDSNMIRLLDLMDRMPAGTEDEAKTDALKANAKMWATIGFRNGWLAAKAAATAEATLAAAAEAKS